MRHKRPGWLVLPWLVVAFAACSSVRESPVTTAPEPTFSIVAPHKPPPKEGADEQAEKVGLAVIRDIEKVQACLHDNPGCDPKANQRIIDWVNQWKEESGCTLLGFRLGVSTDPTGGDLQATGDDQALTFKTRAGVGAAAVIERVPKSILLQVDDGGVKRVTYFGVIVVTDCGPSPQPGLGDTT